VGWGAKRGGGRKGENPSRNDQRTNIIRTYRQQNRERGPFSERLSVFPYTVEGGGRGKLEKGEAVPWLLEGRVFRMQRTKDATKWEKSGPDGEGNPCPLDVAW